MIETHPFGTFVPPNARYLILGSFPGKQAFKRSKSYDPSYDWYYRSRRNQFWPIMEAVYGVRLRSQPEQQKLMEELGIGMGDVILRCTRTAANNSDLNLANITYNVDGILKTLEHHDIHTIFFTSSFVAQKFRRHFKDILRQHSYVNLVTLPSPSPRYALMSKAEKIKEYRYLLPNRPLEE